MEEPMPIYEQYPDYRADVYNQEEIEASQKIKRKDCATCNKKNILIKPNETSCIDCRHDKSLKDGPQLTSSLPNINSFSEMNSYLGLN